ncbi:hypothetical protein F9K79_17430 [Ochrobactrum sp. Kaboul]|nr:hypothetical protein F9K79_17430 [Ochrobactrum sp. Kaboul]
MNPFRLHREDGVGDAQQGQRGVSHVNCALLGQHAIKRTGVSSSRAVAWAAEDEFTAGSVYLNRRFVTNICWVFPGFASAVTNYYRTKNILKNIVMLLKMITDG